MSDVFVGTPLVSVGKAPDGTLTAEQYANVAVHKILSVSMNAHPVIREQANSFREKMYDVLSGLFAQSMADERARIFKELK